MTADDTFWQRIITINPSVANGHGTNISMPWEHFRTLIRLACEHGEKVGRDNELALQRLYRG